MKGGGFIQKFARKWCSGKVSEGRIPRLRKDHFTYLDASA